MEEEATGTVIGYPTQYYKAQSSHHQLPHHPPPQPNQPTNTAAAAATTPRNQPINTITVTVPIVGTNARNQPTNTTTAPPATASASSQVFIVRIPPRHSPATRELNWAKTICRGVFFVALLGGLLALILDCTVFAYDTPDFHVNHFSETFSFNNNVSAANWEIVFDVKNPNSINSFSYSAIQVFLFNKDEFLTGATLPPFHQGKKNTTMLHASLAMPPRNMSSTEPVSYTIKLGLSLRPHPGNRGGRLIVYCDDVSIGRKPDTSIGLKECTVRIVRMV